MKIKILTLTILSLISIGCNRSYEPIENYKGAIIYDKQIIEETRIIVKEQTPRHIITIRVQTNFPYEFEDTKFQTISTMPYDYNRYNVGDTIK